MGRTGGLLTPRTVTQGKQVKRAFYCKFYVLTKAASFNIDSHDIPFIPGRQADEEIVLNSQIS
jgi:hypothetical protein